MRIFEIMSEHVRTVPPTLAAVEAWDLMHTKKIHHLIVHDGDAVVGILSDGDLGGPHGGEIRAGHEVAEFMHRHFTVVAPDDTVRKAANLMVGREVGCLPVMHNDRLVGIVTIADLLAVLGGGIDRPGREHRPLMHHRVPHRKMRAAAGRW